MGNMQDNSYVGQCYALIAIIMHQLAYLSCTNQTLTDLYQTPISRWHLVAMHDSLSKFLSWPSTLSPSRHSSSITFVPFLWTERTNSSSSECCLSFNSQLYGVKAAIFAFKFVLSFAMRATLIALLVGERYFIGYFDELDNLQNAFPSLNFSTLFWIWLMSNCKRLHAIHASRRLSPFGRLLLHGICHKRQSLGVRALKGHPPFAEVLGGELKVVVTNSRT